MPKNEYGEAVIKWVTISVLIAVSVFFIILYRNIYTQETETGRTEDNPPVVASPPPTDEDNDEDPEDPIVEGPIIVYNTFPREAITNSQGEFYLNTGGVGNEKLMDVIDFAGHYYLILETNSNGKDYRADRDSVALCKINYNGEILNTLTLNASRNEYYVESKITNNGILIAARGQGGITYYNVTFNLTYSKAVTQDSYTSIKMFYTRDYTLCAGIKDKMLTLYAIDDNLNKLYSNSTEFDNNVSLLEILPSAYGFNVIVNVSGTSPAAYINSYNNSGDLLSKSVLSNNKILKLMPVSSGYAMLEQNGLSIYLRIVNQSLVQQFRTLIGDGSGGDFYSLHNGYIVFLYNDTGTLSKHISPGGDIITYNDWDYHNIIEIKSSFITSEGIYFYADVRGHGGTKNTRVVNYTKNNLATYSNTIGGFFQDNAVKILIRDNKVITFMTTHSNNSSFMNNYGGSDIFVFANNK